MHVNNRLLLSEIRHYQSEYRRWQRYMAQRAKMQRPGCRPIKVRPRASEELGAMIWTLCDRLTEHRYFRGYTYRHDLAAAGASACLDALPKFDTLRYAWDERTQQYRRPNAFSYFTMTAWRAMRKMQTVEQHHSHSVIDEPQVEQPAPPNRDHRWVWLAEMMPIHRKPKPRTTSALVADLVYSGAATPLSPPTKKPKRRRKMQTVEAKHSHALLDTLNGHETTVPMR